jgi:hypothetical protein
LTTFLFAQGDAIRTMMKDSADGQAGGGGVTAILERYRKAYSTRESMGTLTSSEIEVRPLAAASWLRAYRS